MGLDRITDPDRSAGHASGRAVLPSPQMQFERPRRLKLLLLGATGSIGSQTLDVCRMHPDKIELVAVAAQSSVQRLVEIAREFDTIHTLALTDAHCKEHEALSGLPQTASCVFGKEAVDSLVEQVDCDIVLNALSGFAGMRASAAALKAGKILALANKESLVAAGDLIMPLVEPGRLLPVDSEHSAMFQCVLGEDPWAISRLWLTASGGPFFGLSAGELAHVSSADALRHPNWNMGRRITVDSSTLMNKGLEIIEAHHLFDIDYDKIMPVVQRQSLVHSMVEFCDGSVKAHLGLPDMRVPIQFALSFPDRWPSPVPAASWPELGHISFAEPDADTFSCLRIALEAGRAGGVVPCAMNAADEVAVAAFLDGRIGYLDIAQVIARTLGRIPADPVESLEQLEACDAQARVYAAEEILDLKD